MTLILTVSLLFLTSFVFSVAKAVNRNAKMLEDHVNDRERHR